MSLWGKFWGHAEQVNMNNSDSPHNTPQKIPQVPAEFKFSKENEEIFQRIPKEFFEKTIDEKELTRLALKNLEVDQKWITLDVFLQKELDENQLQLDVINTRINHKVMENYNSFVVAMTQIHQISLDLSSSLNICQSGRKNLKGVKENLIENILKTLDADRKRQHYEEVHNHLMDIQKIVRAEDRVFKALESGDYPQAIELCLQSRSLISNLKHFVAVKELSTRMKNNYQQVKSKLGAALNDCLKNFNSDGYVKVLTAYRLTGQDPSNLESQLQLFYKNIVESTATEVIITHQSKSSQLEQLKQFKFRDLCGTLDDNTFFPCLSSLFEHLLNILYGHYKVSKFHTEYTKNNSSSENHEFFEKLRPTLSNLKRNIWESMQYKIAMMLGTFNLSNYKIDDFLKILNAVHKFSEMGEEYSGFKSPNLSSSVKKQSESYFDAFHKNNLEHLKPVLESEAWQKCPVVKTYTVMDIIEFKNFLRPHSNETSLSRTRQKHQESIFESFEKYGNPFSKDYKKLDMIEVTSKAPSYDVPDELKADDVYDDINRNEKDYSKESGGPILASATVSLARYIGKYLHMLQILQQISFKVFEGITEIYEVYLHYVYSKFSQDEIQKGEVSTDLYNAIQHLNTRGVRALSKVDPFSQKSEETMFSKYGSLLKFGQAKSTDSLGNLADLSRLPEKAVGLESLNFIQGMMNKVKEELRNTIPKSQGKAFNDFYSRSVDTVPELVRYLYRQTCIKLIFWETWVNEISNMRWDTQDIDISPYVTAMVENFKKIEAQLKQTEKFGSITPQIKALFWEELISYTMTQLVEAYSRVKKCTDEGRAKMSLDFQSFCTSLEKITGVKPLPKRNYVYEYIKAYYKTYQEIIPWAKNHPEYTLKQWISIVNIGPAANLPKKTKSDLLMVLEELDKSVRK